MTDEASFLRDLVILLAAAIPLVYLLQQLKVPSLVGFLAAGVILGPHGMGAIASPEQVERLAEVGVALLLFAIGLELSVGNLLKLGSPLLLLGGAQIVATAAAGTALARLADLPWRESLLMGFLAVHSSTVVALKMLADRGQVDSPQGRIATGILVQQDLAIIPMMLLVPVLGAGESFQPLALAATLAEAMVVVLVIVVGARVLLPKLLRRVAHLGLRELFTVTVLFVCLGTAWLAQAMGLTLAIGALIAGLVISDSEYSHQVFAEMVPLRDIFTSLFFVSVGMLLRTDLLVDSPLQVLTGAAVIMLLKAAIITALVLPAIGSLRLALVVGSCLSQVGELAIVLAGFARPYDVLDPAHADLLFAIAVLSFVATPLLVLPAERLGLLWQRLRGGGAARHGNAEDELSGHVVVIGYGLNGQNLARVLRETGIAFRAVAIDPRRVAEARRQGDPIIFGDATRPDVLRAVAAERAAIVVIAISDPAATRRVTAFVRRMNPSGAILVRTRYLAEIDQLYSSGASEVIVEELETSVEIFARVLHRLHIPRNVIDLQVDLVRSEGYEMLREVGLPRRTLRDVQDILAMALTETFLVDPASPAAGCTIRELRLRSETGVTIIALVHDGVSRASPDPDTRVEAGDVLVLLGNHADLERALARLST